MRVRFPSPHRLVSPHLRHLHRGVDSERDRPEALSAGRSFIRAARACRRRLPREGLEGSTGRVRPSDDSSHLDTRHSRTYIRCGPIDRWQHLVYDMVEMRAHRRIVIATTIRFGHRCTGLDLRRDGTSFPQNNLTHLFRVFYELPLLYTSPTCTITEAVAERSRAPPRGQ